MKNIHILNPFTALSVIAAVLASTCLLVDNAIAQESWPEPVTRTGDTARFQDLTDPDRDPKVVLVPPGQNDTEICSYSPSNFTPPDDGPTGKNCFRFENRPHADNSPGAMVILLHDPGHFYNSGPDQFSSPRRSYASAYQYSEIWSDWYLAPTQGSNLVGFTERSDCTLSPATHVTSSGDVILAWPGGCDTQMTTRSQSCETEWGEWSAWSPDPSTIPVGQAFTQTRARQGTPSNDPWTVCATSQSDSRPAIGDQQPTDPTLSCPDSANWGQWSAWDPDPETINDGQLFWADRTREDLNGDCEAETERKRLTGTKPVGPVCSDPDNYGAWGNWAPDPASLAPGTHQQSRSRDYLGKDSDCPSPETETRLIVIEPPTPGVCSDPNNYGLWSTWNPDAATLPPGTHTQTRSRDYLGVDSDCDASQTQTQTINVTDPTPGVCSDPNNFGSWTAWIPDAATLDPGTHQQSRSRDYLGADSDCPSPETETQLIVIDPPTPGACSDPSNYGSWSAWAPDAATLLPGTHEQSRSRNYLGTDSNCPASETQVQTIEIAEPPPPVCSDPSNYGQWTAWAPDPATLLPGTHEQSRSRNYLGTDSDCPASETQVQTIEIAEPPPPVCSDPSNYGQWTAWAPDPATLLPGTHEQSRSRNYLGTDSDCPASETEVQTIEIAEPPPPVCSDPSNYGQWTAWAPDAATLPPGDHDQTRTRDYLGTDPDCPTPQTETQTINIGCSDPGNYGQWSVWTPDEQYLSPGTYTQTRSRNYLGTDLDCPNPETQSREITVPPPEPTVDCYYSNWTPSRYTVLHGLPMTQYRTLQDGSVTLCLELSRATTGLGVYHRTYRWIGAGAVSMSYCNTPDPNDDYAGGECNNPGAAAYVLRRHNSCQALQCTLFSETIGPPSDL